MTERNHEHTDNAAVLSVAMHHVANVQSKVTAGDRGIVGRPNGKTARTKRLRSLTPEQRREERRLRRKREKIRAPKAAAPPPVAEKRKK